MHFFDEMIGGFKKVSIFAKECLTFTIVKPYEENLFSFLVCVLAVSVQAQSKIYTYEDAKKDASITLPVYAKENEFSGRVMIMSPERTVAGESLLPTG